MAANYVLLEKITVGAAGASSVTFSGIPQTGYTDLVVSMSIRSTSGTPWINMRFNGASTNYSGRRLEGNGSTAGSASNSTSGYLTLGIMGGSGDTASTFSSHSIYIPNYTSANYKSTSTDGVTENNATAAYANLTANLWSDTAAITSILLIPEVGSLVQYSTFYLYGVAALGTTPVISPYATGGDTIMTDGTYWYHTFVSSGTFTPAKALSVDYLVVAGGGGGGASVGAGGGGGGMRTASAFSTSSGVGLTVTVGAGGAAGPLDTNGSAGADSIFSTITSTGGGYGARFNNAGGSGGSGGGAGRGTNASYAAGNNPSTSPSQGANGGSGINTGTGADYAGGGGGGGGASGTNGGNVIAASNGGDGGAGTASSISGSSVTYAGGGGGGTQSGAGLSRSGYGGTGGGGAGAYGISVGAGVSGTANTGGGGGGGGGGSAPNTGGAGGSGIVIVRYAV